TALAALPAHREARAMAVVTARKHTAGDLFLLIREGRKQRLQRLGVLLGLGGTLGELGGHLGHALAALLDAVGECQLLLLVVAARLTALLALGLPFLALLLPLSEGSAHLLLDGRPQLLLLGRKLRRGLDHGDAAVLKTRQRLGRWAAMLLGLLRL